MGEDAHPSALRGWHILAVKYINYKNEYHVYVRKTDERENATINYTWFVLTPISSII